MSLVEVPDFKFCLVGDVDSSFLPVCADSLSTGWDVKSAADIELKPFDKVLIPLGIKCFIPNGWWLELRPRSSTFAKQALHSLYGVIDESYEGEIKFAVQWIPSDAHHYKSDALFKIAKGDRVAQLVPKQRHEIVSSLVGEEEFKKLCEERGALRGAGGFGSSGK